MAPGAPLRLHFVAHPALRLRDVPESQGNEDYEPEERVRAAKRGEPRRLAPVERSRATPVRGEPLLCCAKRGAGPAFEAPIELRQSVTN